MNRVTASPFRSLSVSVSFLDEPDGAPLVFGTCSTPVGEAFLAGSRRGVRAFGFLHPATEDEMIRWVRRLWPGSPLQEDEAAIVESCSRFFSPDQAGESISLFLCGTPFQRAVWTALLRIPEGGSTSYGRLAAAAGHPGAARAAGTAVGQNPISLLIPCHRVLRADGSLGAYRWGEERKRTLLDHEACAGAYKEGGSL